VLPLPWVPPVPPPENVADSAVVSDAPSA